MSEVTKPIALDESINTTEQTPRNIADVLAEELAGIAGAITTAESVEDILTDMATTKDAQVISGTAVFDTIDGNLVKALKVEVVPSQAGSGTPSPSNIRPISGYTEEVISVKDSTDTTQETYTTPFNQTVYGGTLDVLTGELTITHAFDEFDGTESWWDGTTASYYQFNRTIGDTINRNIIANELPSITTSERGSKNGIIRDQQDNYVRVSFTLTNTLGINSLSDFKTWLGNNNLQICYELTTPITIQLTPQTVKSLVGENHISASTGDVTECKFSMLINGDDLEMLLS